MNLKTLVVSACLIFGASLANAQETPDVPLTLAPSGIGTSAVTFNRAASGLFVDTFSFTPASFAGLVSVHLASTSGPVSFYAALLNGQPFGIELESGQASTFDFQATVGADVPLRLQVLGFGGDADTLTAGSGAYSGTITTQAASPVPEPTTYGLLLAGVALLWARGRRSRPLA